MERCERSEYDFDDFGECVSINSSCQKSRNELTAEKRKVGINYKKWLSATRMVVQATKAMKQASKALKKSNAVFRKLKGAVKEECTNGE